LVEPFLLSELCQCECTRSRDIQCQNTTESIFVSNHRVGLARMRRVTVRDRSLGRQSPQALGRGFFNPAASLVWLALEAHPLDLPRGIDRPSYNFS
jgi:hypothetical protein